MPRSCAFGAAVRGWLSNCTQQPTIRAGRQGRGSPTRRGSRLSVIDVGLTSRCCLVLISPERGSAPWCDCTCAVVLVPIVGACRDIDRRERVLVLIRRSQQPRHDLLCPETQARSSGIVAGQQATGAAERNAKGEETQRRRKTKGE